MDGTNRAMTRGATQFHPLVVAPFPFAMGQAESLAPLTHADELHWQTATVFDKSRKSPGVRPRAPSHDVTLF